MTALIGVEEHVWTPALRDALIKDGRDQTVRMIAEGFPEADERLADVGEQRLSRMNASGIQRQVLSVTAPGTQTLAPAQAISLARDANDFMAEAVAAHPDRFTAFATLPTPDPEAAAQELERCVGDLGMVGAMLFPRTGDRYLDDDHFRTVFEVAAQRRVPVYVHPQFPPRAVRGAYFTGFGERVDTLLASGGWGWHAEAGIAALRLILAGTFDRHPDFQLMLGHWGEMLVPFVDRANVLSGVATALERSVADYVSANVLVTVGGIYSRRMLLDTLANVGPDRVLFASDDPFGGDAHIGPTRDFLTAAPISDDDRAKIARGNAERCGLTG